MKKIMTRAHQIRKEAAVKFSCKTSDIIFSICLKMAWSEKMNKETVTAKWIKEDVICGDEAGPMHRNHVEINGITLVHVRDGYGSRIFEKESANKKEVGLTFVLDGKTYKDTYDKDRNRTRTELTELTGTDWLNALRMAVSHKKDITL